MTRGRHARGATGPMRLTFLSVSDQLGGSEIALLDMIGAIRRIRPGWTIHAILPGRGPLLDRAERAGADCTVLEMPGTLAAVGEFAAATAASPMAAKAALGAQFAVAGPFLPGYVRRLRRMIRAQGADVLHTNGLKAHILGARAAGDAKVLWHMHEYVGERGFTKSLMKMHAGRASAIVANSSSVAADVEGALALRGVPRVIHNAVDLSSFTPEGVREDLDARSGFPPSSQPLVRIGLVGTFARWKGHETFLRAVAAIPRTEAVRAYIIGEPLYETAGSQHSIVELRAMARQLGVEDRVGFTGFLRAAPAMRALDVVVHASTRPEPFGLVIAEAMACGRAVITSACGGARELVDPGVDALTHTPGDKAGLTAAILRLVRDEGLRRALGQRARASALQRFDTARLGAQLVEVYEQIA
ncbi:MAG TPA: glycosyltransferase family 4 protein [Vicinamibacterales bacterium]|nr:glycosyltransferase family 4 protein [Vicinamibacterales bacterium]